MVKKGLPLTWVGKCKCIIRKVHVAGVDLGTYWLEGQEKKWLLVAWAGKEKCIESKVHVAKVGQRKGKGKKEAFQ